MRMDRRALNRNTLPFIDLHQERRTAQNRRAILNTKRLFGLALLVLIQATGLLPLTLQALAFRPKIARAAQSLAEVDKRLLSGNAEKRANGTGLKAVGALSKKPGRPPTNYRGVFDGGAKPSR